MDRIAQNGAGGNLPTAEIARDLEGFLEPVLRRLPEERLRRVCALLVRGIVAGQSPLITVIARSLERDEASAWPLARRGYRFLWNQRFSHWELLKGMGAVAQRTVARYAPKKLVIAIDPVNLEKPYTWKLQGVSRVLKSTPPGPKGEKRITSGYPAITATVVNLPEPAIPYARWFSYQTEDFTSENRELERALRVCHVLFRGRKCRYVGDAGLDDQKVFRGIDRLGDEFVIRVSHEERLVEVYNERLKRWEREPLLSFVETVPFTCRWKVLFTHAHTARWANIALGWFRIRLPGDAEHSYWVLVAHDTGLHRNLVLITNVAIEGEEIAREVYADWRCRSYVEHSYRFDQERGVNVEDISVHTLERMRRLFLLVLLATLFVYHLGQTWSPLQVQWLLHLGGKLDLPLDADGPYLFLAGIRAVLITAATLTFAAHHPFPRDRTTYG